MEKLTSILTVERQKIFQNALVTDILVLSAFFLTITFAHLLPIPMYKLDPMKVFVMLTVMYSSRGNALFISLSLPVLSFVSTGHPVAPKFILMGGELMVFAWIISTYQSSRWGSFFSAIVISKIGYYVLKAGAIWAGWLNQSLFATDWQSQGLALTILSVVYFLVTSFRSRDDIQE